MKIADHAYVKAFYPPAGQSKADLDSVGRNASQTAEHLDSGAGQDTTGGTSDG